MIALSVSRRSHRQKIQWNCSEGEREKTDVSESELITIIGYQTVYFANNYCEGKFITARETVKLLQTTTYYNFAFTNRW